jgi:antirestriction protein
MSPRRASTDTPRIYVADLAAYNAGTLHGEWIDADQGADHIRDEIRKILAASPEPGSEEYAIHDFEGFGPVKIAEYEALDTVARIGELISEHGGIFAHVLHYYDNDVDEAVQALEERYQGAHNSLADWAQQFAEETGQGDCGPYSNYIDWEAVGRDAEMNGDVFTIEVDGQVHVFYSN